MSITRLEEEPIAYEPTPIPDTVVTGAMPVEALGGLVRLTFYSDRRDGFGTPERTIVARLVLARSALAEILSAVHAPSEEAAGVRENLH